MRWMCNYNSDVLIFCCSLEQNEIKPAWNNKNILIWEWFYIIDLILFSDTIEHWGWKQAGSEDPEKGPVRPAKRVHNFLQDRNALELEKMKEEFIKLYDRIEQIECLETRKKRRVSLIVTCG